MSKFLEPFVYRLTIRNRTRRDLALRSCQRVQGIWCREETDGEAPVAVPAGGEVEALAIRGATNNPKGYEFRCSWGCPETAGEPADAFTISISVPYLGGRNRGGMDVSGRLKVEGWNGVAILGHCFQHTLTVSYISPT